MKITKPKLPSNKKFGLFFSIIFLLLAGYFYLKSFLLFFCLTITLSIILLIISFLSPTYLLPFNKLWMGFGLVLGMIVSPIVMGMIFFAIFMPIGILMRLFGRDELLLQFKTKPSYWMKRNEDIHSNSFKSQF